MNQYFSKRMCLVAASALLLSESSLFAQQQETNLIFKTTVGWGDQSTTLTVNEHKREALPAEEFREGNWGTRTNGLQMSIRVYGTNESFTISAPIPIVILLRNAGQSPRMIGSSSAENYPFDLIVRRNGEELKPVLPRITPQETFVGSHSGTNLDPQTQHRFVLQLEKIYDLSRPGDYEVTASRGMGLEGRRPVMVQSGWAKFQIADKPPSLIEGANSKSQPATTQPH